MKKWSIRILTALLTFAIGIGAALTGKLFLSQAMKFLPVSDTANINLRLPPTPPVESAQALSEIMKPHPVSISPYEIKRLVDEAVDEAEAMRLQGQQDSLDLTPVLEQLGIKDNKDDLHQWNYSCAAEIIKLELDGKPGKETLLRLGSPETDCYLIFKQAATQSGASETWELLGYIDAFTRWSDRKYRVVVAGTQRWLAVEETTGHGSAYGTYAEHWYEANEKGVLPVLSYETSYFIGLGASPMIDRKTQVLKVEYQNGIASVILKSVTAYEGCFEQYGFVPLWRTERKATFIRGPGMQKFVLDPLHSEMAEKELDPFLGEGENITDAEFLKYNYRELVRMAAEGNTKQKEWLRNYLSTCDDTLEKQSLQKALGDS